jgi:hypothetical protein
MYHRPFGIGIWNLFYLEFIMSRLMLQEEIEHIFKIFYAGGDGLLAGAKAALRPVYQVLRPGGGPGQATHTVSLRGPGSRRRNPAPAERGLRPERVTVATP